MNRTNFSRAAILLFLLLGIVSISELNAQDRFELSLISRTKGKRIPEKSLQIAKTDAEITIDGVLDEEVWQTADKAHDFHRQYPTDDTTALSKTEASILYDDNNLYVGVTCFDELEGNYIVESLRRDYRERNNDYFMLIIDPFDDLTNGYAFTITPLGVQMEGLITGGGGGFMGVSDSWDNVWYSKTKKTDEGWTAEFKIPFKSIRYADDISNWNIQFVRNDLKRNERSTWTTVKRQYQPTSLTYSGELKWEGTPPEAGSNISIIPYVSGSATQPNLSVNNNIGWDWNAGFDGKVALSTSLNLDLTLNPDFSTVEVDQQQTNVTRFELFYPERRQFFIENSDLFSDFGFRRSQVFFSRRIGLSSPMIFGARLSGQVGDGLRVGFLNAQTKHQMNADFDDTPAYNFTVGSFKKQLFGRSNISGIFAMKQAINFSKDQEDGFDFGTQNEYNRVYGLQYNLMSADDKWDGSFYYFNSDDPVHTSKHWAHGTSIRYNTRKLMAFWTHEYVAENFNAEMGFFPRTGYFTFGPFVRYSFYPDSKTISTHGPSFRSNYYMDTNWEFTDKDMEVGYGINFLNSSRINLEWQNTYVKLFDDFDPTWQFEEGTEPLPSGSEYTWNALNASYSSNSRKDFSFDVRASYGGFYNGNATNLSGTFRYRIKPIFSLAMNYTYNKIDLPNPNPSAAFWLVGPRIDLTFSEKVFWTNFIQYNEQADNVNINSRLQWRFAPVSDIFLVYTENFLPDGMVSKNRGLIVKMSYWINL
nr:DUF5916 domain-containing protein [uncultured Draconibacterium sp.]